MCLTINKLLHAFTPEGWLPNVAAEPIDVYKVLQKFPAKGGKFLHFSPIVSQLYHLGENKPYYKPEPFHEVPIIRGGYMHAYRTLEGAEELVCKFQYHHNFVIVKAVIPEGAKYFVGTDGDICADRLVINDFTPLFKEQS